MKMTSHMKQKIQFTTATVFAGILFTTFAEAAELSSLHWKSSLGEDAIIASVDEKVQVKTSELDGGKRPARGTACAAGSPGTVGRCP